MSDTKRWDVMIYVDEEPITITVHASSKQEAIFKAGVFYNQKCPVTKFLKVRIFRCRSIK